MKKLLSLLLSLLLILSLTACTLGGGESTSGEDSQFGGANPASQQQEESNSLSELLEGLGGLEDLEGLEEIMGNLSGIDLEGMEDLGGEEESTEDRSYRVDGYDAVNIYGSVPEPPEGISFRNTRFFDKKSKWRDDPPMGEGELGNNWELEFFKVEFDCNMELFAEWLTAFQNWGWLAQEDTSNAEETCWYLYYHEDYYAVLTYSEEKAQSGYELGCQLYVQPTQYEIPYMAHGVPIIQQGIMPYEEGNHECYDEEGNYLDKEFSIDVSMEDMPYEWRYCLNIDGLTLEDVHTYCDYLEAYGWPLVKAQEPLEPIYEMWDEAYYDFVKGDYYISLDYYLSGYLLVINIGKVAE